MFIFDKQVIERKKYDMNSDFCIKLVGSSSSPKVILDPISKQIVLYVPYKIIVFVTSSKMAIKLYLVLFAANIMANVSDGTSVPRNIQISGQQFILSRSNEPIVMVGPNVVVKGPPYMPYVRGDTICNDVVNDECTVTGSCISCDTFNQADVDHMKSLGWNTIRLGVVWAGAQPRDEDSLDPEFVERLHAVLDLTDANEIHVILDNHGDMVGSAGCGNGAPMWFQKKAVPELIGKQLVTHFPYNLLYPVENLNGYDFCGSNATMWEQYAGDPNYNIRNECCKKMNSNNPPELGFTSISQKTMDYMVFDGPGRQDFVRFWKLMAEAVKDHPSAFAAELTNEPITIRRREAYNTWRACAEAIHAVIPDMSVSICDVGEGAVIPSWLIELGGGNIFIDADTEQWIKSSNNLFYAFHYYSQPKTPEMAVQNALAVQKDWDLPSFNTEFGSCEAWNDCADANISHTYWHYSSYCTTGPSFGDRIAPDETFGACILGWAGADSSKSC